MHGHVHTFACLQDVDQSTGEDLNPVVNRMLVGGEVKDSKARNPDRYIHSLHATLSYTYI